MKLVDQKYLRPGEIGQSMYNQLRDELNKFTYWETIVFCTELQARLAMALGNPVLSELSKLTMRHVYALHYNVPHELYPNPTRPTSEIPHELDDLPDIPRHEPEPSEGDEE